MSNLKMCVIGLGEVGSALKKILGCDGHDPFKGITTTGKKYDILHIAIPYNDKFDEAIKEYRKKFHPIFIVNHSSVPVGTSRKLKMIHSPIRGVHPHLERGIRTIVKFIGAVDIKDARYIARVFNDVGIKTIIANKPEDTEAAKLWCTTGYGLNILLEKEIYKYCQENKVDFDCVYTQFVKTYNEGYKKLGMPQYTKYNLRHMDGKIGGHCICENIELLKHPIGDYVKQFNERITLPRVQKTTRKGR